MAKLEEDRMLTAAPGFWNDSVRAASVLREIKTNKFWIDFYQKAKSSVEDCAVLQEFFKAGEGSEQEMDVAYRNAIRELDDLEFRSTLNQPEDEMPAVVTINSGAGGTESQDWAEMLLRMYRMYGEKQ
ncbi:MAG TPA: PCRF domain-containing protein, partial [Chitinophagaceae bacterium]|nr:PCRF domain-containing protein [Chitinophagaceae bacterium]